MSSKKKSATQKAPESKPRYALGQKVCFIFYHKGKPEEIVEGIVVSRTRREYEEKDFLGKRAGIGISYSYMLRTSGVPVDAFEKELYPSFFECAKVFAKSFLTLLK
jgi:hypothetical protein